MIQALKNTLQSKACLGNLNLEQGQKRGSYYMLKEKAAEIIDLDND